MRNRGRLGKRQKGTKTENRETEKKKEEEEEAGRRRETRLNREKQIRVRDIR